MTVVEEKYKDTVEYFKVYSDLISAARNNTTLNYKDVARVMGLPESGNYMGAETGHLLGEISENEHINGRPMLSALALQTNHKKPGEGFYVLASQLNLLDGNATTEDKRLFWEKQCALVYKEWSD